MALEIERKFLVKGDFKPFSTEKKKIVQGYLSLDPGRSIRVRIVDNEAFLTIKGISGEDGLSRFEWETAINPDDARNLIRLHDGYLVEKYRFIVPEDTGLRFEVDEFIGDNSGLVIAELEIPDKNYPFVKPACLGNEITGNDKYYNVYLAVNPFKNWK